MRMRVSMATLAFCLASLVSGCASAPGLYVELGVGVKLATSSAELVGRDPTGRLAVGYELTRRARCELAHWSHYRDGPPFNARDESRLDELACVMRWGGRSRAGGR